MKAFIAVATLALVAVASAQLGGGHHGLHGGWHHHDIHAFPAYKYSYGVADKHTGDVKSASEVRHGALTKGSYSLVQPDGVVRIVTYVVDGKHGFQAQVHNKGHAHHVHHHIGHHHSHHHGHHHGGHLGGVGGLGPVGILG